MMPNVWIMSIIPCVLLLSIALLAKLQLGSWLGPSCFLALYWALALFVPLLVAPDFDFWPGASWFILLMIICFHAGVLIGVQRNPFLIRTSGGNTKKIYRLLGGRWMLLASAAAGTAAAFVLVLGAGYSPLDLFNLSRWDEIGLHYTRLRYALGQSPPFMQNILNLFVYMGAGIGGVWVATRSGWHTKAWGMLPLVLGFVESLLTSTRTGLIWMFTLFVGSYAASVVITGQHLRFLSLKRIIQVGTIVFVFIFFYFGIQTMREGESLGEASISLLKTGVTVLSPPFAFSHWLRESWYNIQPTAGVQTLGGLAYLLGIPGEQALGWEGTSIRAGGLTWTPNVYTAFRQLIDDFTVGGAFVAFLVFGVIIGKAYHELENGRPGWLPILALFYAVTLGSYVANWMTYTTSFFGWVLFALSFSPIGPRLLRKAKAVKSKPKDS